MNLVQIVLSVSILLGVYWLLTRSRQSRLLIVLTAGCSLFFIFLPNVSTSVAHLFGVGRGSDLIIYLSIVILGMLLVRLYLALRTAEQEITQLARMFALQTAIEPGVTRDENGKPLPGADSKGA